MARSNGIRERLDAFVETGLAAQFQSLGLKIRKLLCMPTSVSRQWARSFFQIHSLQEANDFVTLQPPIIFFMMPNRSASLLFLTTISHASHILRTSSSALLMAMEGSSVAGLVRQTASRMRFGMLSFMASRHRYQHIELNTRYEVLCSSCYSTGNNS
jgi:hypothetical protein